MQTSLSLRKVKRVCDMNILMINVRSGVPLCLSFKVHHEQVEIHSDSNAGCLLLLLLRVKKLVE